MTIIVGGSVVINSSGTVSGENVPVMYFDIASNPSLPLTSTPQLISGWTQVIPSVGVSVSDGSITFSESGILQVSLERVYQNNDQNPTLVVEVDVDVRKNGVSLFSQKNIISTATNINEPAIASFTSVGIREISTDDSFEIYISATDGVTEPQSTLLKSIRMVGNLIHNPR